MPESDRLLRRAERRQAAHGIGRDSRIPRHMSGQMLRELDHARLFRSGNASRVVPTQRSSDGRLYYVVGISDRDESSPDLPQP